MDQWLGLGILLLGVGLGALLTRIADIALRGSNSSSAEGKATNFDREDLSVTRLQPRSVGDRRGQMTSNFQQTAGGGQRQ